MIDLSELECTCLIPVIGTGDRKVAEMLGILDEEAHVLNDAIEQCLDEAIAEQWEAVKQP